MQQKSKKVRLLLLLLLHVPEQHPVLPVCNVVLPFFRNGRTEQAASNGRTCSIVVLPERNIPFCRYATLFCRYVPEQRMQLKQLKQRSNADMQNSQRNAACKKQSLLRLRS
jgi:hypothetical protein